MKVKACAKLNLTLDICGKRDDGYHIIDSVFQSVGLFDTVSVEKSSDIAVACDAVCGDNIAHTAAKEFFEVAGIAGGAYIKIEKNIPVCAGLGGGSADAAAVITALDVLYNTALTKNEMLKIALKCGADVPYFLFGGTARVQGVGEKVTPLKFIGKYCALIVKSGEKESTADMYKKLDLMPAEEPVTGRFVSLLSENRAREALALAGNAFLGVQRDTEILRALLREKPIAASLSGSGPSYYAVFENKAAARAAAKTLIGKGVYAAVTEFTDSGLYSE